MSGPIRSRASGFARGDAPQRQGSVGKRPSDLLALYGNQWHPSAPQGLSSLGSGSPSSSSSSGGWISGNDSGKLPWLPASAASVAELYDEEDIESAGAMLHMLSGIPPPGVVLTPQQEVQLPAQEEQADEDEIETAGAVLHVLSNIPPPGVQLPGSNHEELPGRSSPETYHAKTWKDLETSCRELDDANITISQIDLSSDLNIKFDCSLEGTPNSSRRRSNDSYGSRDTYGTNSAGASPPIPPHRFSSMTSQTSGARQSFFSGIAKKGDSKLGRVSS